MKTATHTATALASAASLLAASAVMGVLAWTPEPIQDIAAAEAEVERVVDAWRAEPVGEAMRLELGALYPRGHRHMLDPASALPATARYAPNALRRLRAYARTCLGGAPESADREGPLRKAWTWHRSVCEGVALPQGFFEAYPWMHPTGRSYVALASTRPSIAPSPAWVAARLDRVHATELSEVVHALPAPSEPHALLAALPVHALADVSARRPLVVTRRHVLTRLPSEQAYVVRDRRAWDARLEEMGARVRVSEEAGGSCGVRRYGLCWVVVGGEDRRLWEIAAAVLVAMGLAGVLGAAMMVGRERRAARRREQQRQRFVLHTLTHELRTPAASLELSLDPLRADFDALSEPAQDAFLRISREVSKLRRVLSATGRFVSLHQGRAGLNPRVIAPEAHIRALLGPWLEQGDGSVVFDAAELAAFRTDPDWLDICVRNLVSNAIAHGVAPVRVVARQRRGRLVIEVRDQGRLERPLEALTTPFERGEDSLGLGLGLSVVQRAAERLGGRLELHGLPHTTFVLTLEALPERQETP